jgi:hypothetical protein
VPLVTHRPKSSGKGDPDNEISGKRLEPEDAGMKKISQHELRKAGGKKKNKEENHEPCLESVEQE